MGHEVQQPSERESVAAGSLNWCSQCIGRGFFDRAKRQRCQMLESHSAHEERLRTDRERSCKPPLDQTSALGGKLTFVLAA